MGETEAPWSLLFPHISHPRYQHWRPIRYRQFEHRAALLHAQEGRQERTTRLLSGLSIFISPRLVFTYREILQAGIGTYTVPQVATPFWSKFSKTLDMMVGVHLDAHVMCMVWFLENWVKLIQFRSWL
jgi:hypothetical protein